jgi:hypothetical protein
VGAAWRRSGRDRGTEGGLGAAWSSMAAWRRRGSGPATVRASGALPRDSGGWRGQHDTDGVVDMWAGTRWGGGRQWLGAT